MTVTEADRLQQCCFTGHRPGKLNASEEAIRQWLEEQIDLAIDDGYVTFFTGCAPGVDIWAGEIVLRRKKDHPALRLIAVRPWQDFGRNWDEAWQSRYQELLRQADLVVDVCDHYHRGVFQQRNEWMADRSSRVIAYYNGTAGGTRNTIAYARKKGIPCCLFTQA